jgi:hypothetical protein
MPRCVADFFIVHGFVVNNAVLLCGFKQTKGKRYENSDSFDRTAAGIGHSVCVNYLCPVVAGGGGMTKDKALKQALEALEGIHPGNMTPMAEEYWNKAITAIKQARSAPVQEPVAIYQYQLASGSWIDQTKNSYDYNVRHGQATVRIVYTTPPAQPAPVQEPVAYRGRLASGSYWYCNTPQFFDNAEPLYTTPPAQPAPVQEPLSELEKDAANLLFALHDAWPYVHGHCTIESTKKAIQALMIKHGDFADLQPPAAQPAVPDSIHHTDLSESLEYIQGWNDCRQAMLEMMND